MYYVRVKNVCILHYVTISTVQIHTVCFVLVTSHCKEIHLLLILTIIISTDGQFHMSFVIDWHRLTVPGKLLLKFADTLSRLVFVT